MGDSLAESIPKYLIVRCGTCRSVLDDRCINALPRFGPGLQGSLEVNESTVVD